MKSKLNQRSLKNLQIFISDSDEEQADDLVTTKHARFLEDRLTYKNSMASPTINYDMPLGLNLMQMFFKASNRRLKMESFLRIKFLYGLSKQKSNLQNSSSFASKSSSRLGTIPKYTNILSNSIVNSSGDSPIQNRGWLISNIMEKLQGSGKCRAEVERVAGSMKKRSSDKKVSDKIDNLERILKDIRKNKDEGNRAPSAYAMKRARAKGEKHFQRIPEIKTKPLSAIVIRTEPDAQFESRKMERSIIAKMETVQDNISPISEKTEHSSVLIHQDPQQFEKVAQKRLFNVELQQKQRLADQLHRLSKELDELKRFNEDCLQKGTKILYKEPQNYETTLRQPRFMQQATVSKPQSQRKDTFYQVLQPSKPLDLRQHTLTHKTNDILINQPNNFSYRITNPEALKQGYFQNGSTSTDSRKPSTQGHLEYVRNSQSAFDRNIQERGRRLVTQPSNPPPQPQHLAYRNISPQLTSPRFASNSQSNLVYGRPYYANTNALRDPPMRTVRLNHNSSGSHLIEGRRLPVFTGYPNQANYPIHREYCRPL